MRLAKLLLTADVGRRNQSLMAHIVLHRVRCVVCVERCGARLDLMGMLVDAGLGRLPHTIHERTWTSFLGLRVFRHQNPLDPLLLHSHASRLYLNTLRSFSPVFFDYWGTFR